MMACFGVTTSLATKSAPRPAPRIAAAVAAVALGFVTIIVLAGAGLVPSPAAAATGTSDGALVVAQELSVVPMVFPLPKKFTWTDTFGAARSGGRTHEGNDIMVPKMTPLLAVVDGTAEWLNLTGELSSYNARPYYNLLLRGDDGNDYFYIHMNNDTPGTDDGLGGVRYAYAPGLTNGARVSAGQLIGWAGDSGNAEDVGSHLHFELHLGGYKNPVDPYASLVAAPLFVAAPPPGSSAFSDVGAGEWFFDDLVLTYEKGIVQGTPDHRFRPYEPVTRAHFAAFLARAFAPQALEGPPPADPTFADVPPSFWGFAEIEAAAAAGFVRGTGDGSTFSPDASISRAEMAAMLCRALGLDVAPLGEPPVPDPSVFPDVPDGYWAAPDISSAYVAGLIRGTDEGLFQPEGTTMRAHAVAVIARALRLPEGAAGV